MPCDYKQYPKDWKNIVARLKIMRGDRCELCFASNGMVVTRDLSTPWIYPWYRARSFDKKKTRIVITTHHIDSDKKNNSDGNLILLCQRCHLRLDRAKHRAKRKAAQREGK